MKGRNGALVLRKADKEGLDQIEDALGGRDKIASNISLAALDKKQEHFLRLLRDPARRNDSVAMIARDAGLLPSQVMDLLRQSSAAKSFVISMGQLAEKIPEIVMDTANKALDEVIECPECFGTSDSDDPDNPAAPCEKCHGRGTIMRFGDLDHKKTALEMGGLLKKGGGVNIQMQQNNVTTSAPGGYFSRFVKSTDADAYNVVIDAEKVEDPDSSQG